MFVLKLFIFIHNFCSYIYACIDHLAKITLWLFVLKTNSLFSSQVFLLLIVAQILSYNLLSFNQPLCSCCTTELFPGFCCYRCH